MVLELAWECVADTVMGGVSQGAVERIETDGVTAMRLTGYVSLENNGGFVQMASDLCADRGLFDAGGFMGVEIKVRGNGETYDIRLRTDYLSRPWQSYRAAILAPREWTTHRIPFDAFVPHKTDQPFDPTRLRRVGILAIGRAFAADVSVAAFGFYR